MFPYNASRQTLEVTVFEVTQPVPRRTLKFGETWSMTDPFSPLHDLMTRFPGDSNYAFHGPFNFSDGGFHTIDARSAQVTYREKGGTDPGFALVPVAGQ